MECAADPSELSVAGPCLDAPFCLRFVAKGKAEELSD